MSELSQSLPAGVSELRRQLQGGAITARGYAEQCVDRINRHEPVVRAFAALDEHRAISIADSLDKGIAAAGGSAASGPLAGVPVGVKDIFDTLDLPTGCGSPIFTAHRPPRNALVVDLLLRAGAYVMGKTVTTEFAHMHPGVTRNPWNPAHTPGGSSSGSAAAVAAGFLPAAIGSQTNGSVIRPAAFCGIVGFKPTRDLIPFAGGLHFSETLDHVGVMARSVDDVALVSSQLVPGDTLDGGNKAVDWPLRIGWLSSLPWATAEDDAQAALRAALERLRLAGVSIVEFTLPESVRHASVVHRAITLFEGARRHAATQASHRVLMSDTLNADLDAGRTISPSFYEDALQRREGIAERAQGWFGQFDVLACLPAPGAAPRRLDITGDPSFCTLWSLTGFPAITLPVGLSPAGLPYGLQLAAPAGQDAALLRAARWCEGVLAFRAVPPLAAA
jgi:Asp-tRNA(Asn)/Glu-tRNA(Gln) amidotransferase A subunit family amidase